MALKRKVHKVELTDQIGTKAVTAIIIPGSDGGAKVICRDQTGGYSFTIAEIDAYIEFLRAVKSAMQQEATTKSEDTYDGLTG